MESMGFEIHNFIGHADRDHCEIAKYLLDFDHARLRITCTLLYNQCGPALPLGEQGIFSFLILLTLFLIFQPSRTSH